LPPSLTTTPFPYTTLFRSHIIDLPGIPELDGHGDAVDVILIRHCFGIKRDIVPVGDKRGTRVETGLCGHRREHDVQLVRCADPEDRKSTRLNSSHVSISYA